jgi:hypothetical protein
MRWLALTVPLAVTLCACGQRPSARSPSWDTPVPAAEPRAKILVELELEPVSDCDERFDLALYEERGVELLAWDARGRQDQRCSERRVTIRYVPGRVTRDALLARIHKLSRRMEVVER